MINNLSFILKVVMIIIMLTNTCLIQPCYSSFCTMMYCILFIMTHLLRSIHKNWKSWIFIQNISAWKVFSIFKLALNYTFWNVCKFFYMCHIYFVFICLILRNRKIFDRGLQCEAFHVTSNCIRVLFHSDCISRRRGFDSTCNKFPYRFYTTTTICCIVFCSDFRIVEWELRLYL